MFNFRCVVVKDLEAKLKETSSSRMRLIVTDGVFSMDGNVAPLKCDIHAMLSQHSRHTDDILTSHSSTVDVFAEKFVSWLRKQTH